MYEEKEWFLLDLPPINLYTANLLQPYFNGVEECRINGIVQPVEKITNAIDKNVQELLDSHNAVKKCIKQCKLDPLREVCIGCKRTLLEIIEAGNKRKEKP